MRVNDSSILHLLKKNDPRGLELLFKYYYRPLVLWADTFLNEIPTAEDLVQDYFVSFWEKKLYERISSDNLRSYLFVSIKNQCLKLLEKKDPLREAVQMPQLQNDICDNLFYGVDYDDITEEMLQALEAEIKKLPPRMRAVLTSVHVEGLSYRETAKRLNISISTVKTLLVNAVKRLREVFSNFFSSF